MGLCLTALAAFSLPLHALPRCERRRPPSHQSPPSPARWQILCGAASGIMGWISIYPLDVLRTRIMSGLTVAPSDGSGLVATAVRECIRESGVHAFHRGIGPTLLRAAPVAGVVLPVYDVMYVWLRSFTAP